MDFLVGFVVFEDMKMVFDMVGVNGEFGVNKFEMGVLWYLKFSVVFLFVGGKLIEVILGNN